PWRRRQSCTNNQHGPLSGGRSILFTQLINFIALAQTDATLVERECSEHGLDWKEVWLLRGEAMMQEQEVPAFLKAI
ncbi:hypothetical protein, partial [Erythrobacter ramosus]